MSKGPGAIESRIADLLAATRDRALSVTEIADYAFEMGGGTPTRAQRLSATRAAHRILRRIKASDEWASKFYAVARLEAEAAGAVRSTAPEVPRRARDWSAAYKAYDAARKVWADAEARYDAVFKATESIAAPRALHAYVDRFGSWMRIHPRIHRDRHPQRVRILARDARRKRNPLLSIRPTSRASLGRVDPAAGVIWVEAEVDRITERNVIVRYAGETARLDREGCGSIGRSGATSTSLRAAADGPRSTSTRDGRIATGAPPAAFRRPCRCRSPRRWRCSRFRPTSPRRTCSPLSAARRRRRIPTSAERPKCFARSSKARDRLLASIGTSAPAPKPPSTRRRAHQVVYPHRGRRRLSYRLNATVADPVSVIKPRVSAGWEAAPSAAGHAPPAPGRSN